MNPKDLTALMERAICEYATELWRLCENGDHNERSFTTEARLRLYEFSVYHRFLLTAEVDCKAEPQEVL